MKKIVFILFLLSFVTVKSQNIPEPKREFRGSWIQIINGQFQGLSQQSMKAKLTSHLDALQNCNINTIIFQVRGEGDACYASNFEPWSRFLTGRQGTAPTPFWDPLEWMVEECHKRGMEIHAWINPYRAKTAATKEMASTHPYMQHPERFMHYGDIILFNPGLQENRQWICQIAADIVSRYDIDGFHMDDYFYPYPKAGVAIPDAETYNLYNRGIADINNWRRDNVNLLIQELCNTIHNIKPWVKFGISPFGIYHNAKSGGTVPGSQTGGLQNYDDLYADVLLWANQGWVDYVCPQVYWQIGHPTADYNTLLKWWADNVTNRPLVIGQDVDRTVKYTDPQNAQMNQLPAKMQMQRLTPGVTGSCIWYSAALAEDHGSYATTLKQFYHTHPAIPTAMPFLDNKKPSKVRGIKTIWTEEGPVLVWLEPKAKNEMDKACQYVVYRFAPGEGKDIEDASHIIAITSQPYISLPYQGGNTKYRYSVTVLDHAKNESKAKSKKVKL